MITGLYVFIRCPIDVKTNVKSTGSAMFLRFRSNGVVEGRGFHLRYTFEGKRTDRKSFPGNILPYEGFLIVVFFCADQPPASATALAASVSVAVLLALVITSAIIFVFWWRTKVVRCFNSFSFENIRYMT